MFSLTIFLFFITNGIFVNSAPIRLRTQILLPFYSLIHANDNSRITSSEIVKEIVRFDRVTEHYIDMKQNESSRILLNQISEEVVIDLKSINTAFMSHRSLGNRNITIDAVQGGQFYDDMRVFGSSDDVCLGFPSMPSVHTADVIVSTGNESSVYYLKQININLKKSEELRSLELYSVFIRRGLNETESMQQKEAAFVVHSAWLYSLDLDHNGIILFNMKYATSEAFYLENQIQQVEVPEKADSVSLTLPQQENINQIYLNSESVYCILVIMVVLSCILSLILSLF